MYSLRPRPRRHRAVAALTAALTAALVAPALGALAPAPATAAAPPGSQTELIFAVEPDYTTPVDSGAFSTQTFGVPASGKFTPTVNGCARGQRVAFAFVPASADAGTLGSAERPAVPAGATVADLFAWPSIDSPGNSFAYRFDPRNLIGKGTDLVDLDQRWPAGTALSLVAVCFTGTQRDPALQPVVADADGYAITSWVQFTTVASDTDATRTSAGFVVGVLKDKPTVTLTGTDDGVHATLTTRLTTSAGLPADAATGRIDFYSGTGAGRTLIATEPVVDTAASTTVDVPPAGAQVVYQAQYVPDTAASATYGPAQSSRYAVVGPTGSVASTTTVSAADSPFGKATSASVTVRRAGAAPTGDVAVTLDGRPLATGALQGGRLTVPLPNGLAAGVHQLGAAYAGNSATGPSTAVGQFTVTKLSTETTATSKKVKPKKKKGKKKRPAKVKVTAVVAATDDEDQVPTGSVDLVVQGKVVATGELAAADDGTLTLTLPKTLPKTRGKKRKLTVTVAFTGGPGFEPSDQEITVKLPRRSTR